MSHNGPPKNTGANYFPVDTGTLSSFMSLVFTNYIGIIMHITIQHIIIYRTMIFKTTLNLNPSHTITVGFERVMEREGEREKVEEEEEKEEERRRRRKKENCATGNNTRKS
jgi:hypothetical protein